MIIVCLRREEGRRGRGTIRADAGVGAAVDATALREHVSGRRAGQFRESCSMIMLRAVCLVLIGEYSSVAHGAWTRSLLLFSITVVVELGVIKPLG